MLNRGHRRKAGYWRPTLCALLGLVGCARGGAATIGFHDLSDPVKTLGWACQLESAEPVRVRLMAETPSGSLLIDSRLADLRRDDLAGVCPGGAAHAFRFSDYAAGTGGAALYGASARVPIRVQVETPQGPVDLPGTPRPVSFAPVGLRDAGLVDGMWRTDRDNPDEGLAAAPLLLGDCVFATPMADGYPSFSGGGFDPVNGCRYGRIVSGATNAATSAGAWPRTGYWVVVANVEDAFDNPFCVTGPPGQSRPIGAPGAGELFAVRALPDGESGIPARKKLHLVLNSWTQFECRSHGYGIPYLSFDAQADRGNDGILTYLNQPGAKTVLRFGITLMDIADRRPDVFGVPPAGATRYSQAHVLIEAAWGGRKRWLFIELLPDPRSGANGAPAPVDGHFRFNWHLVNSFLYPGADYLFKSAAAVRTQCAPERIAVEPLARDATWVDPLTRANARRDYMLDLQQLFGCLQRLGTWGAEPMPAHPVPVTGIHFGIEQDDAYYRDGVATGGRAPNALWIAVDGVRLD